MTDYPIVAEGAYNYILERDKIYILKCMRAVDSYSPNILFLYCNNLVYFGYIPCLNPIGAEPIHMASNKESC